MYAVVIFCNDNEVSAVPESWLADCSSCLWPPLRRVSKLIKNQTPPTSTWKPHEVRIIKRNSNIFHMYMCLICILQVINLSLVPIYEVALRLEKAAETQSDLESEKEGMLCQRKRSPPQRLMNVSEAPPRKKQHVPPTCSDSDSSEEAADDSDADKTYQPPLANISSRIANDLEALLGTTTHQECTSKHDNGCVSRTTTSPESSLISDNEFKRKMLFYSGKNI